MSSRPPYPEGNIVGSSVCGSWPGGECLHCKWIPIREVTREEDAILRRAAVRSALIVDRGRLIGGCPSCGKQDCFARSCTRNQIE